METKYSFWSSIPDFIGALTESRWVSIDLVATGISPYGPLPPDSTARERYEDAKKGAEMFQILQLGFTFCKYNEATYEYDTKTFEYPVSPLFSYQPGSSVLIQTLNRNFSTSARRYALLQKGNFPFSRSMDLGVPYLSRNEELEIKRRRIQLREPEPIEFSLLYGKNLEFYRSSKAQIRVALENAQPHEYIHVPICSQHGQPLNDLEINIIQQLLQQDFPSLVVKRAGDTGDIYVTRSDPTKASSLQLLNMEALSRHIGIRHLLEAIAGGDFASYINPQWVSKGLSARHGAHSHGNNRSAFGHTSDLPKAEAILKTKRPIIVGHNLFRNLAIIYRTFFGTLPETVDEFLSTIHQMFPRIVDTQYMFVRGQEQLGAPFDITKLEWLYGRNQYKTHPIVKSTDNFITLNANRAQRAGYRSAITMVLFLKQAFYTREIWSDTPLVAQMVYQPSCSTSSQRNTHSHRSRDNIIDQQASQSTLVEDQVLEPNLPVIPAFIPMTASTQPLSILPEDLILPWSNPFWREFGNKTAIGRNCRFEFM
ncbi:CAF1-domain-containing protein [Xylaria sp. FL1777]|nr:CAF1-domain-containing protein [Xylaria sp. FL1777]